MNEAALAQKKCAPCRGGVPPLNPGEVQSLMHQATGWSAIDVDTKIASDFRFRNFCLTLDFVTAVGELAKFEFHHPVSISLGWGYYAVVSQTKKIKGLHENDFVLAAKPSEIAAGMGAEEPRAD